ncbi:MAG: peptidoglycan-associated lipoprotein Pal [Bdellovibrionales bacterium]|jgi:peptidoglycan-associated lipoprotein|nr:peptidoglycan-associated lipoprotein Pal [Bdellovibrionales bacterium]
MKLKTLAFIALSLLIASCSTTKKSSTSGSSDEMVTEGSSMGLEINGDSDSGRAGALNTVYFAFDSSALSTSTRRTLSANAEFLKNNPKASIQIEGHCDERGGVQYNLALGERRAMAVRNYLSALGISTSRMSTISYGKERPLAFGHDEESWSKNRRANFVIVEL